MERKLVSHPDRVRLVIILYKHFTWKEDLSKFKVEDLRELLPVEKIYIKKNVEEYNLIFIMLHATTIFLIKSTLTYMIDIYVK